VDRGGDQGRHHLSSTDLSGTDLVSGTGHTGATGRRPWWTWAAPFAALLALLCVRNRFLFSAKLYEQGDGGANSILIEQAKHFTLLVGNYSREHFNHPGPAFMYVQAAGEWLLADTLHLVPTAWNAHMLAVFALDCAFVGLACVVVFGWIRSASGAAAGFAVIIGFAIAYPPIVNSDWMPYMYVLPYVVFVLAAGSVLAGAARDVWIVTLSGWLLIHGHACFLLFVPVIVAATVLGVGWRYGWRRCADRFFVRGVWVPVCSISGVFLLPIVVELVLHWPGNFGKYLSYSSSGKAGGHGVREILHYTLWFWWPHAFAWAVPVVLYAGAIGVVWWLTHGALRGFLVALLVMNVVSTLAFIAYATVGIDDLSEYYIGYFYWSAPLITVLVIVLGVVERVRWGVFLAVAVAVFAVLAVIPGARTSTNDIDEALPGAVATLAARAPGKTIVLHIDHPAWVQTTGFLVQAERTGVRACVDDSWYTFLFTSQFICTPAQVAAGVAYSFDTPSVPAGAQVVLRFDGIAVTSG
jgi:hypothetical protein